MYYRQLGQFALGTFRQTLFAGASLEVGGAFDEEDGISAKTLEPGGSIYVGADTFIGPAYLGLGFADGGRQRIFFAFGDRF